MSNDGEQPTTTEQETAPNSAMKIIFCAHPNSGGKAQSYATRYPTVSEFLARQLGLNPADYSIQLNNEILESANVPIPDVDESGAYPTLIVGRSSSTGGI